MPAVKIKGCEPMESYRPTEEELLREMRRTRREGRRRRLGWALLIWAALSAAAGAFLISRYYRLVVVRGPGMGDTLPGGSVVLCRRMDGGAAARGDIVLFSDGDGLCLRRVIGVAGDRLVIDYLGEVRLNGQPLEESYVSGSGLDTGILARRLTVAENELYVLGDQRSLAVDSRYDAFGTVETARVTGKAVFVVWPLFCLGTPGQ